MGERCTHPEDCRVVARGRSNSTDWSCLRCGHREEREPAVDQEAADVAQVMPQGWGWPMASRKAHYFIGGMSLCRKWMYTGALTPNQSSERGPDDCAECHRRVAAYGKSQVQR